MADGVGGHRFPATSMKVGDVGCPSSIPYSLAGSLLLSALVGKGFVGPLANDSVVGLHFRCAHEQPAPTATICNNIMLTHVLDHIWKASVN